MKKRILSLLLCIAMLTGLTVPTLADNNEPEGYSAEGTTATVASYEALLYAQKQEEIEEIVVNGCLRISSYTQITKSLTVNKDARVELDVPEDDYGKLELRPGRLDGGEVIGPTLTNNGTICGDGGLWLFSGCTYVGGENSSVDVGDAGVVRFVDYRYGEGENDLKTTEYPDDALFSENAGHVVATNTVSGFSAAAALEDKPTISLTNALYDGSETLVVPESVELEATLMTEIPLTVPTGVSLTLSDMVNMFYAPVDVKGTLNIRNENRDMCFLNAPVEISGTLNNSGALNINGKLTVATGGKLNNSGTLYINGGENNRAELYGTLCNVGRLENHTMLYVKEGGCLDLPDSEDEITYDPDSRNDEGEEMGWETAYDHVLFNRAYLAVEQEGTLKVGGALQNDGKMDIYGNMSIFPTAEDNLKVGIINGAMRNFGELFVDGGKLTINSADTERRHDGALVNIGECEIINGGQIKTEGRLYHYGWLEINGKDSELNLSGWMQSERCSLKVSDKSRFCIAMGGEFYNESGRVELSGGMLELNGGYLRSNDGNMDLNSGTLLIKAAPESNEQGDDPKCSVLCNNGNINVGGGAALTVDAGSAGETKTYSAMLCNNGWVNLNGGDLNLFGTLDNNGTVKNFGSFKVYDSSRIYNHGHLQVDDSATFGRNNRTEKYGSLGEYGDINSIEWYLSEGTEKESILSDDVVYRIWEVNGPQHRCMNENLYQIRDSEYWGNIVMHGQDYYGGWINAKEMADEGKIDSFSVQAVNYDPTDNTKYIEVGEANERFDTFRLRYREWGNTQLKIFVDGEEVRSYDAGVDLNYLGFYTSHCLDDSGERIDENAGREYAAVRGNCYTFDVGDQLWLMRKDDGFDAEEGITNVNDNNYRFNIYPDKSEGGAAEINGPDEYGWFYVSMNQTNYVKLRLEQRENGKFDILMEFLPDVMDSFDLNGNICDTGFSLRCLKPALYVADTPALKGGSATVAVRAENFDDLLGYQVQLKYDTEKLTATEVKVNGKFYAVSNIDKENGTVRVLCGTTEEGTVDPDTLENKRINGNDDLFYVTFTVADTDAVEPTDELPICFDGDYEQTFAAFRGDRLTYMDASLHAGSMQTFIPGDVYRDGKVNILDAVNLLRYTAELTELSDAEYEAALVVAGENAPSVVGVLSILKYLAGIGEELSYRPTAQG